MYSRHCSPSGMGIRTPAPSRVRLQVFHVVLVIAVLGCGDKGTPKDGNNGTNNGGSNNGVDNNGFCEIGTADCGCSTQFPCKDEGYFCVDEVCVECADGAEGCACNDDGTCDAGLSCINPDPSCMFDCAPSTCESGGGSCGPTQLCERTINECSEPLTQDDCEGWYAVPANCTDMDAYTTCNCGCVTEAMCDAYFACGNNCFNDHCN